jgi:hypothetical protein
MNLLVLCNLRVQTRTVVEAREIPRKGNLEAGMPQPEVKHKKQL